MVALSLDAVRDTALVVVGGAVVVAIVLAWAMKAILSNVLSIVVIGAVATVVWSQRSSVQNCADRVSATLTAGAVDDTTCTFFGREVTVGLPW